MQQAFNSAFVAGFDHFLDEVDMDSAKIPLASFVQYPDQVDDGLLIRTELSQIVGIGDAGFEQTDIGMYQQCAVAVWSAARNRYLPAPVCERVRQLFTDKTAATEKQNISLPVHTAFLLR